MSGGAFNYFDIALQDIANRMEHGKSQKQAIAIALNKAGKSKRGKKK